MKTDRTRNLAVVALAGALACTAVHAQAADSPYTVRARLSRRRHRREGLRRRRPAPGHRGLQVLLWHRRHRGRHAAGAGCRRQGQRSRHRDGHLAAATVRRRQRRHALRHRHRGPQGCRADGGRTAPGPVHRLRGRPQHALGAGPGHDRAGQGTGRQAPDPPAGLRGRCARGLLRRPQQDLEGGGLRPHHARRRRRRQGAPGGQRHQGLSAGQGRPAGHASLHRCERQDHAAADPRLGGHAGILAATARRAPDRDGPGGVPPHARHVGAAGDRAGKPFNPDARTQRILEEAARTALAEMRVVLYASRNPARIAWQDRAGSGSRCSASTRRQGTSVLRPISTSSPATAISGAVTAFRRRSASRRSARARFTGWPSATEPAPISTAARATS